MRRTLDFMKNSSLREKVSFCFPIEFYKYWQNFPFGRKESAPDINSMNFLDFYDTYKFSKILSHKLFGSLWGNSYVPVYY